jgi:hypothetical protein
MPSVKGTAVLPAVKLVKKNRAKMDPYLDPGIRKFCDQRIMIGSWYPMEQVDPLMLAVCRFIGGTTGQAMEFIGSFLARNDLGGVYQHLVTVGGTATTLGRSATLWRNYFDTGVLRFEQPDPDKPEGVHILDGCDQNIPYCNGIIGMAKVAIEMTGGEIADVTETKCNLRGDPHCEIHIRWELKQGAEIERSSSGTVAKIKGTALVPAVKFVRKNREKMEPYLDDVARRLASARILPGSWYPVEDVTHILEAICKFLGGSLAHSMEMLGTYCAEEDLNGLYAHLITPGDPSRSFRRAVMLWPNYQDTGRLACIIPDPARPCVIIRLKGYLQTIPYCAAVAGMARVVARLTGVEKTFKVRQTHCTLLGDSFCEFEAVWG